MSFVPQLLQGFVCKKATRFYGGGSGVVFT